MDELFEFIMYNYGKKNEEIAERLDKIIEKETDEELKNELYSILAVAKGYTEYVAKNIAELTGLSRTKVKTSMKQLLDEGKVDSIVENQITFIIPKL